MGPTGPACASVPADGEGSFAGMADDPAATAASNNPELSTLVAAVAAAGLVDTLNGAGPFTIFAPANSAFDQDPDRPTSTPCSPTRHGALTDILTCTSWRASSCRAPTWPRPARSTGDRRRR